MLLRAAFLKRFYLGFRKLEGVSCGRGLSSRRPRKELPR